LSFQVVGGLFLFHFGLQIIFGSASSRIIGVIGMNGASVLTKVRGTILAALSVEYVLEALGVELWLGAPIPGDAS
jgi:small neutral amino acid transporter SnatA (MarC family)